MAKEYFPFTGKIPFEGKDSKNVMAFHYYEPEKVVMGKKMKDWLKFAMAWWHTLGGASADQFGGQTRSYEWDILSYQASVLQMSGPLASTRHLCW